MFPENIIQATFQQVQTKYIIVKPTLVKSNLSVSHLFGLEVLLCSFLRTNWRIAGWQDPNAQKEYVKAAVEYIAGMNVLGKFSDFFS